MATDTAPETYGQIIKTLPPGPFKTLRKVNPAGALQARRQANDAVALYWRYSLGKASERVLIGFYDPTSPPKSLKPTAKGYSVLAALESAQAMALEHRENIARGGRPALLAEQADAHQRALAAHQQAQKYTLGSLLAQYCDHLESLGRKAHRDARSIFKCHVSDPWPEVCALPANKVTSEQIADMMRRLLEGGKGRTANKLRSYVRAAYQTAKASRTKASVPESFKAFQIVSNPAADTEPDELENRSDKKPLTVAELRLYWQTIRQIDGFKGALLRLHLLTGGQRIEQLVKLLTANVSDDAILLFDGKGRPGRPARPHSVPLIHSAAVALLECQPAGTYALSTDGGETHVAATTLSQWAADAGREIPGFKAKRIRSGVETLLAGARISSDHRGRLQSHGISGVQARHYDGHDYMDEKRQALETLFNVLEAVPHDGKVIPLRTA